MASKTYLTAGEQWDKTVSLWLRTSPFVKYSVDPPTLEQGIGVVMVPNRWTMIGDIMIAELINGADRWGFTGVSSKGRRLVSYYQTQRPRKRGGRVMHVELPAEMANLSPLDPVVRRFALETRRAWSNSPRTGDVTACDGTLPSGGR